ncbi:hypothetical protein FB107DRAFT_218964 [Schizophyllum commune]
MVLTLAPFSGVDVTSKIALWEMRAKTHDSPAPMRLKPSRIASSEDESPSSSCSLPSLSPQPSHSPFPSSAIGEICHARICYYVAETQEFSPVVELAGVPSSVELAGLPTVSLVSKPKTSSEYTSSSPAPPFESATSRLPFESATSRLPFESATFLLPFKGMIRSPSVEDATSPPSPSSATFSVSTKTNDPLDALDLEGIKHVHDFPLAAPLPSLLWRRQ